MFSDRNKPQILRARSLMRSKDKMQAEKEERNSLKAKKRKTRNTKSVKASPAPDSEVARTFEKTTIEPPS